MRTRLVRIGNSRGVRLPQRVIEEARLGDELELTLDGQSVILRSLDHPRAGWEEAFAEMARFGDDQLIDPPSPTEFDDDEWQWP